MQKFLDFHQKYITYAKSLDSNNYEDLVQEMYLKLISILNKTDKEINPNYCFFIIRSIFLDEKKKKKITECEIHDNIVIIEDDEDEKKELINLNFSCLTPEECLVIQAIYGYTTFNGEKLTVVKGTKLINISRETGIKEATLRADLASAKKKLRLKYG